MSEYEYETGLEDTDAFDDVPEAEPDKSQQNGTEPSTDPMPNFPEELKKLPNFLLWKMLPVGGKLTKKPLQIDGSSASSTNPATWTNYANICRAAAAISEQAGIGLALGKSGCGYTFVDIDGGRNPKTGGVAPWAKEFIAAHPTYCEITPSGFGMRCIFRGQPNLPNGKHIDSVALRGGSLGVNPITVAYALPASDVHAIIQRLVDRGILERVGW
jgi:hypothetical protein